MVGIIEYVRSLDQNTQNLIVFGPIAAFILIYIYVTIISPFLNARIRLIKNTTKYKRIFGILGLNDSPVDAFWDSSNTKLLIHNDGLVVVWSSDITTYLFLPKESIQGYKFITEKKNRSLVLLTNFQNCRFNNAVVHSDEVARARIRGSIDAYEPNNQLLWVFIRFDDESQMSIRNVLQLKGYKELPT
jgi:hypothetical protein